MAFVRIWSWFTLALFLLLRSQNWSNSDDAVFEDPSSTVQSVYSGFRSFRVVSINWKRHSFLVQLLLSLCGDVHLNPGPDVFPCGLCKEPVSDNDKAICCDGCDSWVHISCDPQMSVTCYDKLVSCPDESQWLCPECRSVSMSSEEGVATQPSDVGRKNIAGRSGKVNSISCLYLNSRSVVSKRSDLFAYLCCHHVDVLAITETFLDGSILDAEICPRNYALFRKDRSCHGGGVLLMFRHDLQVSHRADLDSFCKELLWMEVTTSNGPLLFGV